MSDRDGAVRAAIYRQFAENPGVPRIADIATALGFGPMLGIDVRVETSCPDCEAPLEVEVRDGALVEQDLRMHFALPPTRWWDDIVFT